LRIESRSRSGTSSARSEARPEQQVHRLADDFLDAGVGAVGLVDQQDHGELGREGLAQHEAGLGQRALGRVDEEDDAVDH
jgi:hypothetical protein